MLQLSQYIFLITSIISIIYILIKTYKIPSFKNIEINLLEKKLNIIKARVETIKIYNIQKPYHDLKHSVRSCTNFSRLVRYVPHNKDLPRKRRTKKVQL